MWRIQNYLRIIVSTVAVFLVAGLSAQTIDEANSLYNEGGQALQEDNKELAVQKFEECVSICETLYEEEEDLDAEELMNTVKPLLPKLFYQVGYEKAKNKDLNGGLEYLQRSKSVSYEMGMDEYYDKSADLASKIYYSFGISKYKAKQYDEALNHLKKAIEEKETNFKAHKMIILCYKAKEDDAGLIAATKAVKAIDKKSDDRDAVINITVTHFYNKGVKAKQASSYDEALESLKTSLEFDNTNADAYFLLTSIYNAQENWDEAVEAATEGLKHESAGNQERFNFELGNAYFGQGNNEAACDAYSKAAIGDYLESANYQMEHVVKCN